MTDPLIHQYVGCDCHVGFDHVLCRAWELGGKTTTRMEYVTCMRCLTESRWVDMSQWPKHWPVAIK